MGASTVEVITPDGLPDHQTPAQQEADGVYLTFTGLATEQLRAIGGSGARLLDAYKTEYGADPTTGFALYGVQALQVILAAIERSDGTRAGVTQAVFSGSGITIPSDLSMLGKDVTIDPATGDVNVRDMSILTIRDGKEIFHKAWPVG